jgi:hypothetical protein
MDSEGEEKEEMTRNVTAGYRDVMTGFDPRSPKPANFRLNKEQDLPYGRKDKQETR